VTAEPDQPPTPGGAEPFHLEPEDRTPRPVPPPPPDDVQEIHVEELAGPPAVVVLGKDGQPVAVSTRTVREREHPEARTQRGALGTPAGWPREAFAYPFRDVAGFAVAVALFVGGDALAALNPFVGLLAHFALLLGLFAWQVRVVARSATGDDRPPPFFEPGSLDLSQLRALLVFFAYLFPAFIVWIPPYLASPQNPTHTAGATIAITAMVALALLVAPVLLLATALGDPRLMWPWRAILWAVRGLVACLAVGAGWAAFVLADAFVASARSLGFVAVVGVSIPLRIVVLAFALVGARALGVVGRRYEL
jgi:hypothetical protein